MQIEIKKSTDGDEVWEWSHNGKFLAAGTGGIFTSPSSGTHGATTTDWSGASDKEGWQINFNDEAGYCLLYLRID